MQLAELELLLAGEELSALEEALEAEGLDPLDRAALRGELSARGRGPITDAVLAARRLDEAGDARAARAVAHAIRLLAKVGAKTSATALLTHPRAAAPEVALAARQLEEGVLEGDDARSFEIARLLAAGKVDEAKAALEREGTTRDLRILADLHRRSLRFDLAARALERAAFLAPRADDAPLVLVSAALARWTAGDVDALGGLRKARDVEAPGGAHGYASRIARDVLESIDRDPAPPRPRVVAATTPFPPCRTSNAADAIVDRVLAAMGRPPQSDEEVARRPTGSDFRAAHLEYALRARDLATIRATPNTERLAAALERGALIVLEEERAVGVGFTIVVAVETRGELLLLQDPTRVGPFLRHMRDQLARSELYGHGALFVCERRDAAGMAEIGIVDDVHLRAIDRCDVDENGRAPPRARIVQLAEDAISIAPDLALPYERLGEALLAEHEPGTLGQGGAFERWHARARALFPDAEWPIALYGRALEREERLEEAGIAWADARARDPFDERNWIGIARTYLALGDLEAADRALRKALSLSPGNPAALALRGEVSLERGDLEAAELDASLACEIGGETTGRALATRARVHEARDELDEATTLLDRAARTGEGDPSASARAARRFVAAGSWEDAHEAVARTIALAPSSSLAWCEASLLAVARADRDEALARAFAGLERCGPDREVLEALARAACLFDDDTRLGATLEPAVQLLESSPPSLLDLASAVAQHGAIERAIALSEHATALMPANPNGPWRTAQILLAHARAHPDPARLADALDRTIALAGSYPSPRVMRGLALVEEDPERAITLLNDSDAQLAPGLVWTLARRAYDALGRHDDALRAAERNAELYPHGVVEPAGFLRSYGSPQLAVELLEPARIAYPNETSITIALAISLTAAGRPSDAMALLEPLPATTPLRASAMLVAARDAGRFEALADAAGQIAIEIARDSRVRYADPWPERGLEAGARLALDDHSARQRLLERAGSHPIALSALVRVERAANLQSASVDTARLLSIAPGIARMLASGAAY